MSGRGRDYCGLHVLADDDPRWGRDPSHKHEAHVKPLPQSFSFASKRRPIIKLSNGQSRFAHSPEKSARASS